MNELMLLLAKVMPKEKLVDMLSEEIENYKKDPSDENFQKLSSICIILPTKIMTEKQDVGKILTDMDRMKDGFELLNPKMG